MPRRAGRQRAAQIRRNVAFGAPRRDGVTIDIAAIVHQPMRGLQDAARFDPAQYGQKLWRRDVADRAVPQPRKDICLEACEQLHRVARFPVRRVLLEPRARDRLEGIQGGIERHEFFLLACGAGIDAICDQLAHIVAPVARLLQSDVRVHAERNPLLLAREAILETPPATPAVLSMDTRCRRRTRIACNVLFSMTMDLHHRTPAYTPRRPWMNYWWARSPSHFDHNRLIS